MRAVLLTLVFCVSFAPRAAAQVEDPWLIIPTTSTSDDAWIEPTAVKVRTELVERGVEVWSFPSAATRFEAGGSAPSAQVTEGDIQEWVDRSTSAIRNLAAGDYTTALEQLNEAQELSQSAAEELNRESERSQRVLDTCLYIVRALLETGSESRAKAMARECRKLVPLGDPTSLMHPPVVMEVLEQVDASRVDQTGSIRVASQPSACTVRVNGVMVGDTPLEMRDLFPGRYRVQVECDSEQRGRVHTANVIAGPTDVFVDVRFDRTVETEPLLHLRYQSETERQQDQIRDAEEISKVVPAGARLLVSAPVADVLQLDLYRGTPLALSAAARIPMGPLGPSRGDIALAVRALFQGECTDFTGAQPAAFLCEKQEIDVGEEAPVVEDGASKSRPRGQFIAGLTLASVGTVSLMTGYILLVPRASLAEDWVNEADNGDDSATQQKWLNMGTAIILTSSVGAASLVAAMPLALPNRAKTPWWAWLAGGLGIGAAAASGYLASTVNDEPEPTTSCSSTQVTATDARRCVRRAEMTALAILTGVTAAPLLTIPLVYLIRPKEAKVSVSPNIRVLRAGGFVSFRGQF